MNELFSNFYFNFGLLVCWMIDFLPLNSFLKKKFLLLLSFFLLLRCLPISILCGYTELIRYHKKTVGWWGGSKTKEEGKEGQVTRVVSSPLLALH